MDTIYIEIFNRLSFLANGMGLLATGVMAGLVILVWNWRLSLLLLFLVQLNVGVIGVSSYGIAPQWAAVQTAIIGLCCLMIALSAWQMQRVHQQIPNQSGSWFLRLLAIGMVLLCWRLLNFDIDLPQLGPNVTNIFVWLVLCAFLIFSLSDTPLFTGIALILWWIPIQSFLSILLPIPDMIILLGFVE
ncbi:MAG: hypothetical protein AAF639_06365, partial [Chloroflexota bacterium]